MKKVLILVLVLGLVFTFSLAGLALDSDQAKVSWTRTWNNVVWINAWKNNSLEPITKSDVTAGYKKWNGIAGFHVDSATQYMVAMNVVGTAPDNYNIVDGWLGALDYKTFTDDFNPPKGSDQMFEYRLKSQTNYISSGRNLASEVMDTKTLEHKYSGSSPACVAYDAAGKWHTDVFPTLGNAVDFKNGALNVSEFSALKDFVGVDGYQPVVAAGPSTNNTKGDTFSVDLALGMAEGDNVASGTYTVDMYLVAMEIIPGSSNNAVDINAAAK